MFVDIVIFVWYL